MVDAIEQKIGEGQWLSGQQPGTADREEFDKLSGQVPNPQTHPNAFAWFVLCSRFNPQIRQTWTGGAGGGAKKEKQEAPKEEAKAEGGKGKKKDKGKKPAKEQPKEEEDEMDLFGDDNEEDKVSSCSKIYDTLYHN